MKADSKLMAQTFWELQVKCTGPTAELEAAFDYVLEANAISIEKQNDAKEIHIITALFNIIPDQQQIDRCLKRCELATILSVQIEELPPIDWVQANRSDFPAFTIGKFWIYGSHIQTNSPAGLIPLCVDAAQAFGSGTHATTKGCILAIERNARKKTSVKRILDLGCGSGILSMVAKSIHRNASIVAADNDKISVQTTAKNWQLNQFIGTHFQAVRSDGFSHTTLRKKPNFDLIIANILARPLRILAPLIAKNLAENGTVILSGLLTKQVRDIRAIYRHHHLCVKEHIKIAEWSTLLLAPKPILPKR